MNIFCAEIQPCLVSNSLAGVAYEEKSITLIFTTGKITGDNQCFDIAIYRTVIVKDTEFFSVNLTSSDFAVIIPPGYESTIVTIYNDPANSKLHVPFVILSFSVLSADCVAFNSNFLCPQNILGS